MMAVRFKKCSVFVLVVLFEFVNEIQGSCLLDLNKDFCSPSPVLLSGGKYLAPNTKDGGIALKRHAPLLFACPGTKRYLVFGNYTTNIKSVEGYCISNTTFQVGRWQGPLADVKCNGQTWFTATEAGPCYTGHIAYKVGYEIQGTFYPVYELCFNPDILNTLYAVHELSPSTLVIQQAHRPSFLEGGLFGKARMNQLYKAANQRKHLDKLLGDGQAQKYVTSKQFLNRGHLSPRADFCLSPLQRATFHYGNVAPQWARGNAGDWAALEEALRRRVHATNVTVTVYTGTHGVMTLPNIDGRPTPLYLGADQNNNGIVPVPMYFYKLVYNPKRKTAAAFVTINSSFYNASTTKDLTFCSDICDCNPNYSWLTWRPRDGTHSFCCDYDEFVQTVQHLPKLDVRGRF